jgi:hypothetical protein
MRSAILQLEGPINRFPAPIKAVAMMAANISEKWVGTNADELFE